MESKHLHHEAEAEEEVIVKAAPKKKLINESGVIKLSTISRNK